MKAKGKVEVLRTPQGRWVWWEGLRVLDYIEKHNIRPSRHINLPERKNNLDGAVLAAIRCELDFRR